MDLLTFTLKRTTLLFLIFCRALIADAQNFSLTGSTAWENAGLAEPFDIPEYEVNILDFGADNTGTTSNNAAYSSAISSLNGATGTVYFPEGEYLFESGISVPSNTVLKGESVETVLKFDLGGNGDAIRVTGTLHSQEYALTTAAAKGSYSIEVSDGTAFEVGQLVRLGLDDEDIMYSSWAYGTLGQVNEIIGINGNVLELADPLNRAYPLVRSPYVRRIEPVRNVGISCFKIIRADATAGQTDNIHFRNTFNCFVRNIESFNCNFGHLTVQSSAHIQIENSYFHHAHAYGGGGQAYGVVFQEAASFNMAQNNSFEHLRHSMLLQSGANGNVYGYNYSIDPYWVSGFLPSNSAGDAVLHGNHTYLNLFEGNVVQNIVVDASHGDNGPHNTFFRNRAELYGFFSDSETPTDSINIIGNEITNSGFPYGLFMTNGNGHQVYGNNVFGTVNPSEYLNLESLYLNEYEEFDVLDFSQLPFIGYPFSINSQNIPAQQNYLNGTPVSCSSLVTSAEHISDIKPISAVGNEILIEEQLLPCKIQIVDMSGRLINETECNQSFASIPSVPATGVYVIRAVGRKEIHNIKVLLTP